VADVAGTEIVDGSAGATLPGRGGGRELACTMLRDAGFSVDVHDVPDDPLDSLYVARPT
jgi:hypothetical protein